jgi:hypothetical protein
MLINVLPLFVRAFETCLIPFVPEESLIQGAACLWSRIVLSKEDRFFGSRRFVIRRFS